MKVGFAELPTSIKSLFNGHTDCWLAVMNLYAGTAQHRHSLVHRNLLCEPSYRGQSGYNGYGQRLEDITKPQLYSFISTAQIVAIAVLAGGLCKWQADSLKYELDQLMPYIQPTVFGAKNIARPLKVRVALQPDDRCAGTFKFPKIKQKSTKIAPNRLYDLYLSIQGIGRSFTGYLKETPKELVELNVQSVPDYLR